MFEVLTSLTEGKWHSRNKNGWQGAYDHAGQGRTSFCIILRGRWNLGSGFRSVTPEKKVSMHIVAINCFLTASRGRTAERMGKWSRQRQQRRRQRPGTVWLLGVYMVSWLHYLGAVSALRCILWQSPRGIERNNWEEHGFQKQNNSDGKKQQARSVVTFCELNLCRNRRTCKSRWAMRKPSSHWATRTEMANCLSRVCFSVSSNILFPCSLNKSLFPRAIEQWK